MMRVCLAKTAADAMRTGQPAASAARTALLGMKRKTNETGGLIVVAPDGSAGIARTTRTMSWAAVTDLETASGS